jgi:tRNA(Ile)-lysidine synthase
MKPKFLTHIFSAFPELNNARVLIAVSGGMDSMVLLHLMQKTTNILGVAHCNFGLRGTDSDADEQLVRDYCDKHQIAFHTRLFDTKLPKQSTQMAARQLRYSWFQELCDTHKYDYVLTAHHADDVLETFFINLSRGTGIAGLKGIPSKSGKVLRPLLPYEKGELLAYANKHQLPWREDLSNATDDYLRNRIRHHVVPAFRDIAPDAFRQALLSIDQTAAAADAIGGMTDSLKKSLFVWDDTHHFHSIDLNGLKKLNPLPFWLHQLFGIYGFDFKEVIKLFSSQSGKTLASGNYVLEKGRGVFLLQTQEAQSKFECMEVPFAGIDMPIRIEIEQTERLRSNSKNELIIDADKVQFPITLRKWQPGDVFYPIGMRGSKKVSKFFKDQKWSAKEKTAQWLLCNGNDVIWIVGQRADRRFLSENKTQKLKFTLI